MSKHTETNYPLPGEVLHYDFREERTDPKKNIKFLQWNIERGYKLQEIIETLKNLDSDVIALQEIDIGCERSDHKDTGVEIAKALKMNYIFVCEFEEIHHPMREKHVQGGGIHGNGILTKYDFDDWWVVDHKHQPFLWETNGHTVREPRRGRRYTLAAKIKTRDQLPILCYTVHLEIFCGLLDRIIQFSELLADAHKHSKELFYQVILGDLNTMSHSIARFSPKYCRDKMRWLSLGFTESEFWSEYLFDFHIADGDFNKKLKRWGLPLEALKWARNDGFYDPFPINTTTVENHRGFYKGKLDWTLFRGFEIHKTVVGNDDYSASDHKYLLVEASTVQPFVYQRRTMKEKKLRLSIEYYFLISFLILCLSYYIIL